jgi:hypothetical protein
MFTWKLAKNSPLLEQLNGLDGSEKVEIMIRHCNTPGRRVTSFAGLPGILDHAWEIEDRAV